MKRINLRKSREPEEGLEKPVEADASGLVWEETDAKVPTEDVPHIPVTVGAQRPGQRTLRDAIMGRQFYSGGFVNDPAIRNVSNAAEALREAFGGMGAAISRRAPSINSPIQARNGALSQDMINQMIDNLRAPSMFETLNEMAFAVDLGSERDRTVMTGLRVREDSNLPPDVIMASTVEPGEGVIARAVYRAPVSVRAESMLSQYRELSTRALQREGFRDHILGTRRAEDYIGRTADLTTFFERTASRIDYFRLSELVFWGRNVNRIAIFLLSGEGEECMVGFKIDNPLRNVAHELDMSQDQNRRRAWAVGELVGWGMAGARA